MSLYEVTYEILTEERTDSFLGSGNTTLSNLKTMVNANGVNQAMEMVQAMNGGWARCRAVYAYPIG